MPNFYAHIRFCLAVRKQLPPRLRAVLTAERDEFLCGGFGPDPLFFYTGRHSAGAIRQTGISLHRHSGAAAMERFRKPLQEGRPFAVSFSAGYLLHYLLDSRCHPYVNGVAKGGELTHFALEGEYDRYLLRQDGLGHREALPKKDLPQSFYALAAEMADGVTPEIYQTSLREFRWMSLKFGDWAGKPVRHALNAVSLVPPARPVRGMILGQELREDFQTHMVEMDRLFAGAVETAAVELGRFFGAVEQNMPFSEALGRDFAGNKEDEDGLH